MILTRWQVAGGRLLDDLRCEVQIVEERRFVREVWALIYIRLYENIMFVFFSSSWLEINGGKPRTVKYSMWRSHSAVIRRWCLVPAPGVGGLGCQPLRACAAWWLCVVSLCANKWAVRHCLITTRINQKEGESLCHISMVCSQTHSYRSQTYLLTWPLAVPDRNSVRCTPTTFTKPYRIYGSNATRAAPMAMPLEFAVCSRLCACAMPT